MAYLVANRVVYIKAEHLVALGADHKWGLEYQGKGGYLLVLQQDPASQVGIGDRDRDGGRGGTLAPKQHETLGKEVHTPFRHGPIYLYGAWSEHKMLENSGEEDKEIHSALAM